MGTPELCPVNVARLRAADRPEVVGAFVGRGVAVTAQWGRTADTRTDHRGLAVALASVYGEPGFVLVVLTDDKQVLAFRLGRLARVALAP